MNRDRVLYFMLVSAVLNLNQDENTHLIQLLYAIQPGTAAYEAFLHECVTVRRNELFPLPGEYTEHLYRKTTHTLEQTDANEVDRQLQSSKKLNVGSNSGQKTSSQNEASEIILSAQFLQNCDKVIKAMHTANFVTINGEIGSGKSTSLEFIALQSAKVHKLIRVYVDESTDLSSLIGNYTCSEKIGEFEWKNGPLVNAMTSGGWLVLENFQEANPELVNNLLGIDKNGGLRTESHAGFIRPELGFKLIVITNFSLQTKASSGHDTDILLKEKTYFVDLNISLERWAENMREVSRQYFSRCSANTHNLVVYELLSSLIDVFLWVKQNRFTLPVQYRTLNLDLGQLKKLVQRFSNQVKVVYGSNGIGESRYLTQEFRKTLLLEVADVAFGRHKDSLEPYAEAWEKIFSAFNIVSQEGTEHLRAAQTKIDRGSQAIRIGRLGDLKYSVFSSSQSTEPVTVQTSIVYNSYSNKIIERVTSCLLFNESCLLVGDTGCGKTTVSQHIAELFGKKLYVYNLNQGSDTIDLVGGFKPVDLKLLLKGLLVKFVKNLLKIVSEKSNEKFLQSLSDLYAKKSYITLMKCMLEAFNPIRQKLSKFEDAQKRQTLSKKWDQLEARIRNIYNNKEKFDSNLAFQFLQGNLVKALKNGDWLLIDEINLANNEVLQKLLPIIEGQSLLLYEKGDHYLFFSYLQCYL